MRFGMVLRQRYLKHLFEAASEAITDRDTRQLARVAQKMEREFKKNQCGNSVLLLPLFTMADLLAEKSFYREAIECYKTILPVARPTGAMAKLACAKIMQCADMISEPDRLEANMVAYRYAPNGTLQAFANENIEALLKRHPLWRSQTMSRISSYPKLTGKTGVKINDLIKALGELPDDVDVSNVKHGKRHDEDPKIEELARDFVCSYRVKPRATPGVC